MGEAFTGEDSAAAIMEAEWGGVSMVVVFTEGVAFIAAASILAITEGFTHAIMAGIIPGFIQDSILGTTVDMWDIQDTTADMGMVATVAMVATGIRRITETAAVHIMDLTTTAMGQLPSSPGLL